MLELLPLIIVLLMPLWAYLLWRRMKSVQRMAREQAEPAERHNITPVEDTVKTEGGFTVTRPLAYDDELAEEAQRVVSESGMKNLLGPKY
jgi:hypothetical protein